MRAALTHGLVAVVTALGMVALRPDPASPPSAEVIADAVAVRLQSSLDQVRGSCPAPLAAPPPAMVQAQAPTPRLPEATSTGAVVALPAPAQQPTPAQQQAVAEAQRLVDVMGSTKTFDPVRLGEFRRLMRDTNNADLFQPAISAYLAAINRGDIKPPEGVPPHEWLP